MIALHIIKYDVLLSGAVMIEVVCKTGVYCRHHPYIGFLYSLAVLVLVFNKYLVVGLIASDVCILLDDAAECLV